MGFDASELKVGQKHNQSGAQTDNEVVTAVASKKLRLMGVKFTSDTACDLLIEDDDSVNKELMRFENVTSVVLDRKYFEDIQDGSYETAAGQALTYTTSTGDSSIDLTYVEKS